MGMYDMFEPEPALTCPRCGDSLIGWQGHDGPSELLLWHQGRKAPIGEAAEDVRFSREELSQFRLPDRFGMTTVCSECGYWAYGTGICEDELWIASVHGTHVEDLPVEARTIDEGWRQCSACGDAWQGPSEASFAECPTCRALTHLATA